MKKHKLDPEKVNIEYVDKPITIVEQNGVKKEKERQVQYCPEKSEFVEIAMKRFPEFFPPGCLVMHDEGSSFGGKNETIMDGFFDKMTEIEARFFFFLF